MDNIDRRFQLHQHYRKWNGQRQFEHPNVFGPSANGLGALVSSFNMTISGGVDLGVAPDASQYNINLIANDAPSTGSLFLFPELTTVNFSGTAVPEPSSVLAVGAIGLCLVGGAWRKRKQQLTATAE